MRFVERTLGAATVAVTAWLAACAPVASPGGAGSIPSAAVAPVVAPWDLPASALGTQRLFRVRYDGPQGEGSLKVTLRLAAADRYQVQVADPLGRPLWGLDVDGASGRWIDHREELTCALEGRLELAGVPLSPFPLLSLPKLLVGRLPAAPRADGKREALAALTARGEATVEFVDAERRRWTARLDGGRLRSWTLWSSAVGGEPRISWLEAGGESILSDREQGVQLRWRQIVVESLPGPLEPLLPPAGYRDVDCAVDGRSEHPI